MNSIWNIILRVNKHYFGKFCASVLYNDVTFIAASFCQWINFELKKQLHVKTMNNCFPLSIKILVKYNTVLLVVKWPEFLDHERIFCAVNPYKGFLSKVSIGEIES